MVKYIKFLALGFTALLLFTGCSSKQEPSIVTAQTTGTESGNPSPQSGNTETANPQSEKNKPQDDQSVGGIITIIETDEVTIAKIPAGMADPGNGNNGTDKEEMQGPKPASEQNPERDKNQELSPGQKSGGENQGEPPERGSGGETDMSKWETVTYKIDDQTKITTRQSGASTTEDNVIDVTDLKVGADVLITPRSNDESIADTIIQIERQDNLSSAALPAK